VHTICLGAKFHPVMLRNYLMAVTMGGAATFGVEAQELFGLGGALTSSGERTYSWEIDYHQSLGEFFAVSGGWINEGHLPDHHRDGGTVQIWARTTALDRRLTLAAGIGPYFYFDTIPAANASGSQDDHGVGFVASLAATWQFNGPWSVHMRANYIDTPHSIDTTSLLLGVGYRLDGSGSAAQDALAVQAFEREVSVTLGSTYVNTFGSEDAFAAQIEYRQRFGPYFAWSAAILNEGDASTQRRSGVVGQLWLGRTLFDQRVTAEVGIGPYLAFDIESNALDVDDSRERLTGIFSLSMSYAPVPRWPVRFTWSRVFAEKSHDTDVFLLGVGYRF
jgi:hypothetical protein